MENSNYASRFHDRFDLSRYLAHFENIPERDFNHSPFVASPFDIYSVEKLRAKWLAKHNDVEKVETEIVAWGRGESKHPAGTKVGGIPVWDSRTELPEKEWKFFGQINFADSTDLLPDLPAQIISIWGNKDFPWGGKTMKSYWIDLESAVPIQEIDDQNFGMEGAPADPFFAQLYRTWDPVIDYDDDRVVTVDHEFEDYREFQPSAWNATKFIGCDSMPQSSPSKKKGKFLAQLSSIQATPDVPFPFVNREQPLKLWGGGLESYHHRENCRVLSDMGSIALCVGKSNEIKTLFGGY